MREAAFLAGCAALGMSLGLLAFLAACWLLHDRSSPAQRLSGREAADMVGDVERWLRTEGY